MINVCSAPNQQVSCASGARSLTINDNFIRNDFKRVSQSGCTTKMFMSTAIVIQNEGGVVTVSLKHRCPRAPPQQSAGERQACVCARACRPTGKRSASRARPRTTAQATSREDFYPLHPFRPHHGRPNGCRGRGGRARLRQARRAEAEERARSEESQVHRALLQATDLLQPLHRLHLVSMLEDVEVLLYIHGCEGHR